LSEKVLITGAAGFIGSHLGERLVEAGARVIGVDNLDDFYDTGFKRRNIADLSENASFEFVEADIRDAPAVDRLFLSTRPDKVIHLAARAGVRPSIEDPASYVSVNVDGTANILQSASHAGVDRMIFASSSSVYGNNRKVPFHEDHPVDHPISPYAATKKAGELLCHTWFHLHSMPITCLRLFTVFGPRQRPDLAIYKFLQKVSVGEEIPVFGDGSSKRDYTYVGDIIDGVMAALDGNEGFGVYNLGRGEPVSLNEMVSTIEQVTGQKALIRRLPSQPGDVDITFADVSRARDEFDYDPSVKFGEGVERQYRWMRDEGRV